MPWGLVMAALTSTAVEAAFIERYVSGLEQAPSLEVTLEHAEAALALPASGVLQAWPGRAHWRALLPVIDLAAASNADLDVRDTWSASPGRTTTEGRALALRVSARWELGGLLLDDLELRAHRQALAQAGVVALARERVVRLYFERLELVLRLGRGGDVGLLVELRRLDGLLAAATDGRWKLKERKGT